MRTINEKDIGNKLSLLLKEEHPIDEDIGIINSKGNVSGVIITQEAYEFFLRKVEEEEDRIDIQTVETFDNSGEKTNGK